MKILYALSLLPLSISMQTALAAGQYQMLGMQHTPQKVLLPIAVNDNNFAANFHRIVQQINQEERLTGGADEISVAGWLSTEDQYLLKEGIEISAQDTLVRTENEIRRQQNLKPNEAIRGFETIITGGNSNFAFFQDIFEMMVSVGSGNPLAMLDLANGNESSDTGMMNEAFRKFFGATKIDSGLTDADLGVDDDGGNLEVTPEGKPYLGSSASDAFKKVVKNLLGQDPIELDTSWLFVSHVDEFATFLPTQDECGAALVHADPLEAINIMRTRVDVPLIPREDLDETGETSRPKAQVKNRFFNSLKYFVKAGSEKKKILELADFDVKKAPRKGMRVPNIDLEFLGNLYAYGQIKKNVQKLQANSRCLKKIVGLPTFFYGRGFSGEEESSTTGFTAAAGYMNLVSLRNHVVIAKEREEFFGPVVRERLASVLGGASKVHEIDASYYEQGAGAVHCATNVIRVNRLWR